MVRLTFDQAFTSLCAKGIEEDVARFAAVEITTAYLSRKLALTLSPDAVLTIVARSRDQ